MNSIGRGMRSRYDLIADLVLNSRQQSAVEAQFTEQAEQEGSDGGFTIGTCYANQFQFM